MHEDFTNRTGVAVVTGGSGGIGAAVCRRLAEAGATVVLTYRTRRDAADALAAELGGGARAVHLDVASEEQCAALAEYLRPLGGVHTLVHAAGPFVPMVHLSKVAPATMHEQLVADTLGFFTVMSALLQQLRDSRGAVVVVTTAATRRYPVRDGLSAGPKGAVEALARGFAAEEGRFGVRVNCVGPGMLVDGMSADLMGSGQLDERAQGVARGNIALRRFGDSSDIAEAAVFLASDRAGFITGQKLDVDGGYGI